MTRGADAQTLALELGAASAQGPADTPPALLDAAILFAPVGELVTPAMEALDRGGTLAIAGIHLSDIPRLNYQQHLFQERQIRSVTVNTRADSHAFLDFASTHHLHLSGPRYSLAHANRALSGPCGRSYHRCRGTGPLATGSCYPPSNCKTADSGRRGVGAGTGSSGGRCRF